MGSVRGHLGSFRGHNLGIVYDLFTLLLTRFGGFTQTLFIVLTNILKPQVVGGVSRRSPKTHSKVKSFRNFDIFEKYFDLFSLKFRVLK